MAWQMTALIASGLILVAAGVPLMRRMVPPNRWYGVRLRATLDDERIWYAVNEQSGRDLIVAGITVVFVALGVPLALPHWPPELHVLVVALVLVVGLAAVTSRAVRHIKHVREG
jgi:uncharacterized membrane protein